MRLLRFGGDGNLRAGMVCGMLAAGVFVAAALGQEAQQPPVPAEPPVSAAPAQKGQGASEMRPAMKWKEFDYTCEGGKKVVVFLRNQTVKIRFGDKTYLMNQTPSADGGRYSDGKTVWWGRGNGGFLQEDTPDGNGAMIVKDCKLEKPLNSGGSSNAANGSDRPGVVAGTVTYRVRMALPPDAVIDVKLLEGGDANGAVVAEKKIPLGQRQVPVAFEVDVEPSKVDPQKTYAVSAEILVEGKVRFASEKALPVLTQGHPSHVEIEVKPAGM